MLKIPSRVSITLSCAMCILAFIGCVAAAIALPFGVNLLAYERNGLFISGIITGATCAVLGIIVYAALTFILKVDILVNMIKKENKSE